MMDFQKPLRKYESVVILNPDAAEEAQKELFRRNKKIIEQFAGNVNHLDTWGKRRLANSIKKFRVGTYFHTTFEASSDCVAELERTMRINENVLRFIHVRLDERQPLTKHLEVFRDVLAKSTKRDQEREAKALSRKAAMGGGGPGGGFGGGGPGRRPGPGYRGRDAGRDMGEDDESFES